MLENQNDIPEDANLTPEQRQQYEKLMAEIEERAEREKKREERANNFTKISLGMFALSFFNPMSFIGCDGGISLVFFLLGFVFAVIGLIIKRTKFTKTVILFIIIGIFFAVLSIGFIFFLFNLMFGWFAPY